MRARDLVLALIVAAAVIAACTAPRVAQPAEYHRMADERTFFGVPNALNVLSNFPFAVVGLLGLQALRRGRRSFVNDRDWWPYLALFGGVLLTAVGSSYYHLAPDNTRLVWDRLPMTIGFMGLLSAIFSERVEVRAGRALLVPLVIAGVASVLYWDWTERAGAGDLRPYFLIQFGSLALVAAMLALYPSRYPGARYLVAGLGIYVVAKWLEVEDARIFVLTGFVSGHTLKHLAAAGGVWCIALMLRQRVEVGEAAAVSR